MAVNPEIDYVLVQADGDHGGERYLLAEARRAHYARELGEEPTLLRRLKGWNSWG